MVLSKKAGRLIVIYALAAVLVMGVFVWKAQRESAALSRSLAIGYDHAFTELTTAVGELDATLQKARCASSPAMVSTVCAQGYAHCAAAGQAIASLPRSDLELEHTAAFLSKAGDYLFYLARSAAGGGALTEEEREALGDLSESAGQVSGALSDLAARLIAGEISTAELDKAEDAIADAEDSLVDTGLAGSFKALEDELPELPALIYDGPFSAHIERAEPCLLKGLEEVGQDAAAGAAAEFLDVPSAALTFRHVREAPIPVFVFTCQSGNEVQTVEVTRAGGRIVYFGTARESGEGQMTADQALERAAAFLEDHGFGGMRPTYHQEEAGELTASFAFEQDGVICYPDLIKVTVAMDTGKVVGMEAGGYTMCHQRRALGGMAFDTEKAVSGLSPWLTVKSHRPAVIPTEGKNEVLCEEYLCETAEGKHALVYLNAKTGQEEQILLLLESESGTLTV